MEVKEKKVKTTYQPLTKHRSGENLFERKDLKFQEYRKKWKERALNLDHGNFPLFIDIETTNVCNFRCTFCSTVLIPAKDHGFIDDELVYKIIDEGKDNGLYGVKFNMRGEPTLHKSLSKFVRYAVDAGLVDVYFNTNASKLDEKKSIEIIESGLTRITFSFEGYEKEYYEKVRVNGRFDKIVGNIRRFYQLREEMNSDTPKIRVSGVLLPEMKQNLQQYIDFWQPYADEVSTNDYIEEDVAKHTHKNLQANWACNMLWQRMSVHCDGTLLACNQDYYDDLTLGNINDTTIKQAWLGTFETKLRNFHKNGHAHKIERCRKCSFRDQQLSEFLWNDPHVYE